MSSAVDQLAPLLPSTTYRPGTVGHTAPSAWTRDGISGRLVELTSTEAGASLTLTAALLLDAQQGGETTAWVTRESSSFFPPDLAAWGVDLDALAVVRVADVRSVGKAADRLARSGAFGLLVLDLGPRADLPAPLLSRLLGLARKHDTAILFLTEKPPHVPSLSSLVSLRAESALQRAGDDRFVAELRATKDKCRAPGWTHAESCCGSPGLR